MKYKFGIHYRENWLDGILGLYVKKWWGWKNVSNQPIKFIKLKLIDEQKQMIDNYETICTYNNNKN